ncbi:carbamoyl-phosphate synthase (glutamine-hydrolyzing) large subunit [Candidatus Woesearchaeota archaeon]|nr:carbamoyl-phosphate synthase (glutamine-hydrolyzing) large subunit [Candidatus Woesearchaeota archaeon]
MNPKKVLVLGSGALKIGQGGEFDYSGSQCLRALREEGIKSVLVNPNIATVQSSEEMADEIYFLPLTPYFIEKVIEKEKPDGIFLSFGGQTALNCGVELHSKGILKKHNVRVLGTQVSAIIATEDRGIFVKKLKEINVKTPRGIAVTNISGAIKAADKIKYPVMLRVAYALGGLGSGVCNNNKELAEKASKAFSSVKQILIEEYLEGWKEIEYEVVRDGNDNCITVCNMENFDPMGIHTGESIVVAPSQTLTNAEYHKLREISIKVIRHLGIIGECNIQFAFSPSSDDYRVIEVNARLSRSSALASKATGYPLAFVAAKLGLGYSLTEIDNSITKATKACFEPALDYIVVKMPRWDLQKFRRVEREIGTEMKSVGEVMAIGRNFEEAVQKAIRMLGTGLNGIIGDNISSKDIEKELRKPTDERVFAIASAIDKGISIEKIHSFSKIDKWFLHRIGNIVSVYRKLRKASIRRLSKELLSECKRNGFSDAQIAAIISSDEHEVRKLREKYSIFPSVKQIDTLAAEYPARTNYLYLTYNGTEDDISFADKKKVMVLGSGAYRIGSSVEFDWCCVNSAIALRKLGFRTIMLNYNPETVSTDYDMCDKLYFDDISFETVIDIYRKEKPDGVIVSMGGQIPNNLALKLHRSGIKILGTSPVSIDKAEDRHKFSKLLDSLEIDQPEWKELTTVRNAKKFAEKVKYPVLIRPSYVLSGAAMSVALNEKSLEEYLDKASSVSKEHPVVVSSFITGAKEIEIDAVANKGNLVCWAISEHIENAGVHSGDATIMLPPQRLYFETTRRVKKIAGQLAKALEITGPFNIQFLAKDNHVKIIELNLRASRSFPFVSKVFGTNFIDVATKVIMGQDIKKIGISVSDLEYVGVKAPQFSFSRLKGSDPTLSVEMASTGEVACFGDDLEEAFLKAFLSVGYVIPKKTVFLSTGPAESKAELLESCRLLRKMNFSLFATKGTHDYLRQMGVPSTVLYWPLDGKKPNAVDYIKGGKVDMVINIPKSYQRQELSNGYIIRRAAVDYNVPLITNTQVAKLFVSAISMYRQDGLKIKSWKEYKEVPG